MQKAKADPQDRYILLEAVIQDSPYILSNICALNKNNEQCVFFKNILEEVKVLRTEFDYPIIFGGDFNVILNQVLDGQGGTKKGRILQKL